MDEKGFTAWYDHPVANSYPRKNGKTWLWCAYDECAAPLKRGDRVRIREEYDGAGEVYFYIGKSTDHADMVNVGLQEWDDDLHILAAAIEPYPYSREERIERTIEDFAMAAPMSWLFDGDDLAREVRAVLFAILDAGV